MHKEKRRSKTGSWRAIAQGSLLLLGIYMAAMLSLAFAVTRDMLKETVGMVPMYMSAMVAAWCGGKWTLKKIEPKANLYAIVPAA